MSVALTWFGHNTWLVESGGHKLLIDPFFNDNPKSPVNADEVEADFIAVSHGHFDHTADAASIAKRTGAKVLAAFEIAGWLQKQGVDEANCIGMNTGGGIDMPFGRLQLTIAHHSSSLPDGSYGGSACGILLETGGKRIYFACDTALFVEMKLLGAAGIDLAVVPIGDLYTMGPRDSVEAVKLVSPKRVAPCHYGTWPPIEQDAQAWANQVRLHTAAEPVVPVVGQKFSV
ncbi:MAG: metal-dependent hydrolase [Planctomycetales bacterium]|nr:metal-dependent hydrolase [Planctomycetales bacterium]